MKSIIRKLKNWWFAIVGITLIILDQGFEVLNPFLVDLGLDPKFLGILKLAFGIYGIYKLKMQMPSQNKSKIAYKILDEENGLIGKTPNDR